MAFFLGEATCFGGGGELKLSMKKKNHTFPESKI